MFNGYVHLARVASLVYLVVQVVTLINFSCTLLNDNPGLGACGEGVAGLSLSLLCVSGGFG